MTSPRPASRSINSPRSISPSVFTPAISWAASIRPRTRRPRPRRFTAVLASYEHGKKAAVEALKQPDRFKNDPWEKARLEALVKGPPPDYVARRRVLRPCLNYEAGKLGEALPKFQAFAKEYCGLAAEGRCPAACRFLPCAIEGIR